MTEREDAIRRIETVIQLTHEKSSTVTIPKYTAELVVSLLKEQDNMGKELTDAMELIHKKNERIKRLEEQIETLTKWRANAGAFD